ncbi:MAG: hypothetical protein OIN84_08410, partial [Candidatus Methanoperedens sp.]|nr:hypothetical protein [Candidatus Methanoperedens sp.]
AAGADPTAISAALLQADSLLAQFPGKLPYNVAPSAMDGQAMVNLAATLDLYNSGHLTFNCTPVATATPTQPPVIVVIQGPVQAINVNVITIAGINVQVGANDPILASIQVGTPIRVEGLPGIDAAGANVIIATVVTPAPAEVTAATLYIQGVVNAVSANIITISGFSIQIDAANPTLPAIQVGDVIEINANVNFDGVTVIIFAATVTIVIDTVPVPTPTFTPTTTPPTATPEGTPAPTPTATAGLPVTIIVEGPVQTINVNIITIYDIDITINADDPVLTQIQIGDFVRVEGDVLENVGTIVVVAVTVFVVEVDVIVSNNNTIIWQDNNDCGNPPPPWAPAHGWRRRCQNANTIIIISDDDDGMGMGMGDDD